ncbi:MAG: hypothetical protein WBF77_13690 [Sulfurimonadaceae bacterium]
MERVKIGENFEKQPIWKVLIGVPLIYLPLIIAIPFVIIGIIAVRAHLKYVGATDVKPFRDFVPTWISHRYSYKNQIVYETDSSWRNWRSYRFYWIFNCKFYCPLSVALFKYMAYLVQIVENWWCPFEHDKKAEYRDAALDKSYWHIYERERSRLHPDDRENPIWNEAAK